MQSLDEISYLSCPPSPETSGGLVHFALPTGDRVPSLLYALAPRPFLSAQGPF